MVAGIYKIINKINGKYYLGSSQNIKRRWNIHKSCLKKHRHDNIILQRAWDKYGEHNFELTIIEIYDGYSNQELLAREQQYLNNLDDKAYNLSKFAGGGDNISYHPQRNEIIEKMRLSLIERYATMSEEERLKMSERLSGEGNPMFGKTHTEEAKKLISTKNKQYFTENDSYIKGKTFEKVFGEEEAIRKKKIISESASSRTGNKNPFYGKHHNEKTKKTLRASRTGTYNGEQNIPIIINGKYYKSLGEASKELNIPITTIRWRVLSKNKKFNNYKYAEKEK